MIRVSGKGESAVEEIVQPIYSRWTTEQPAIDTTILAGLGQVELHLALQTRDAAEATARLDRAASDLAAALGKDVVSTNGDTLEAVVGQLLKGRGWWVAFAESCTGGLATSRLTDIPGSSEYVERSIVAYSNRAKIELLGVPEDLIVEHGAVSEPVALAMAAGIRTRARVNVGVGITGIAGPGGGSADKPVGTVCIAVDGARAPGAGADGGSVARTFRFPGGRDVVKGMSANWGIDMLRRFLLGG
jgi:nicotinamide-nucleotide amidase